MSFPILFRCVFFCYSVILVLVFVLLLLIIYFFILLYYEVHGVCLFFFFVLLSAPTLPHKQQAGGEREKRERRGTNDGETRILMPPSTRPFSPRGVSPYLALEQPAQEALDNEAQGPLEALEKQKKLSQTSTSSNPRPSVLLATRQTYQVLPPAPPGGRLRRPRRPRRHFVLLTRMAFTPCEKP